MNELPDSMSKCFSLSNFRSESNQSTSLSSPYILWKGMKLNEHVNHFIPEVNSMMLFGMYAFVNKVSNINWNCLTIIKKPCGDDRLINEDTEESVIVNSIIA